MRLLPLVLFGLAAASPALGQDAERGRQLFNACAACHPVVAASGQDGPSLAGILSRGSAVLTDFRYSRAMGRAGLTWDEATLDRYLADPQGLVPGTRMAFSGLERAADRADVIAYLKSLKQ